MLDYLRLSPMIGGGSLSLKSSERTTTRERQGRDNKMKCNECEREVEVADGIALCHYHYNNETLCGDCLVPIKQCAHKVENK